LAPEPVLGDVAESGPAGGLLDGAEAGVGEGCCGVRTGSVAGAWMAAAFGAIGMVVVVAGSIVSGSRSCSRATGAIGSAGMVGGAGKGGGVCTGWTAKGAGTGSGTGVTGGVGSAGFIGGT
jgi:hypothetical protein